MNSNQTAQQLRLAADLIDTKHPWEFQTAPSQWLPGAGIEPQYCVSHGLEIRPILATPPDGRPLHNPDNLDAEKVGVGYRLALKGERVEAEATEFWYEGEWLKTAVTTHAVGSAVFRLPLSVPWPEVEKPDPYAKLKAAHVAGKVIERISGTDRRWLPMQGEPRWFLPVEDYRIKPDEPAFQLPPPPPGTEWHREDGWKEGDLPQGWRPLAYHEYERFNDEHWDASSNCWVSSGAFHGREPDVAVFNNSCKHRTTRPLTFAHAGQTWTYHKPGDPMPCDGEKRVAVVYVSHKITSAFKGSSWSWSKTGDRDDIIGWRYAETETPVEWIELGPEDVPPSSTFHHSEEFGWAEVHSLNRDGVWLKHTKHVSWRELLNDAGWQINRSIPLPGKWNPDAWEPCKKPAPTSPSPE